MEREMEEEYSQEPIMPTKAKCKASRKPEPLGCSETLVSSSTPSTSPRKRWKKRKAHAAAAEAPAAAAAARRMAPEKMSTPVPCRKLFPKEIMNFNWVRVRNVVRKPNRISVSRLKDYKAVVLKSEFAQSDRKAFVMRVKMWPGDPDVADNTDPNEVYCGVLSFEEEPNANERLDLVHQRPGWVITWDDGDIWLKFVLTDDGIKRARIDSKSDKAVNLVARTTRSCVPILCENKCIWNC